MISASLEAVAGQWALLLIFGVILIGATRSISLICQSFLSVKLVNKPGFQSLLAGIFSSLPELFLTIAALFYQQGELVVALLLGANLANLSLSIGIAATLAGPLTARDKLFDSDSASIFLLSALPLLLLSDFQLTHLEGLGLILAYLIFLNRDHLIGPKSVKHTHAKAEDYIKQLLHNLTKATRIKQSIQLASSIIIAMLVSLTLIFIAANSSTNTLNSPFLWGLIPLAIVASIPELLFEAKRLHRRQSRIVFGSLTNSLATNSTALLGFAAFIQPISLTVNKTFYLALVVSYILIFILFWIFARSKHALNRLEGILLIGAYVSLLVVITSL